MNKLSCEGLTLLLLPSPPSLPSSSFHCHMFSLSLLPFLCHHSLSLFSPCFTSLTLVPTSLKSLICCLPPHFYNLVYFLPHSCFLYLCCFSSFPLFAPPHPFLLSRVPLGLRQKSAALKPLYQHIPAIVAFDSNFHCRIA